jgi:quercetin dioxygenase-like cupin family protein
VRRIDEAQLVTDADGFVGRKLLSRQGRGELEVYVLDLEPGARRRADPHSPGVIEHVIVISGPVEIGPQHELVTLDTGDCLTFAADLPHCYYAPTGPVRLLSLTDYP